MKYSQFNILVPFDFSEESITLLKHVLEVQSVYGFTIHLLHASNISKQADLSKISDEVFAIIKKQFSDVGSIKIKVVSGEQSEALLDYAGKIKADLVFVKGSLLLNKDTGEISSEASKLLLNITCPVIVLNRELIKEKIKSILLPLDLNLDNELKIAGSIFFASIFNGAIVRIASIVHDTDDFKMNKIMHRLQDTRQVFDSKGIDCVGEIIRCNNAENFDMCKTLVDYVDNQTAEIVLLVTNDEEEVDPNVFHPLPEHMLMEYTGNMICINPKFILGK